jgi:hypothetical protein
MKLPLTHNVADADFATTQAHHFPRTKTLSFRYLPPRFKILCFAKKEL